MAQCLQDNVIPLEDVVPLLNGTTTQAAQVAMQSFIPLQVAGDRQYLLSLRHGALLDRQRLLQVLQGSYSRPAATTP